ncbi:unnamed protein product [Microthlaspi erraticum]|uniref:Uncharacterized protein n=1 Tax=Microthlaspi erraticum TaxID=1685480 RepID=A0A6D2JKE6_9BRAS|nr:unnamed protein product [Microthlaspi erraticum]
MNESDDQEEGNNTGARDIVLGEQHDHPPNRNDAHDQTVDESPKELEKIDREVMGDFYSNRALLINRNPIHPPLPGGRSYEILPRGHCFGETEPVPRETSKESFGSY